MITSKEIKIKKNNEFSADYINKELSNLNLDVLRWAITSIDSEFYTLNIAIVED